jgi:hypothetical protein
MKINIEILSVLITILFGAIGYYFSTFYIQPILHFKKIRQNTLTDLIFYANVVNDKNLKEEIKDRYYKRIESNRLSSCELIACIETLPKCYKEYLKCKGIDIHNAALLLMKLSNCSIDLEAAELTDSIIKTLGFKVLT